MQSCWGCARSGKHRHKKLQITGHFLAIAIDGSGLWLQPGTGIPAPGSMPVLQLTPAGAGDARGCI
jgi:hypothetical protein